MITSVQQQFRNGSRALQSCSDTTNGEVSSVLTMNRAYFQLRTAFARRPRIIPSVLGQAGCFTRRRRMIRGFGRVAFPAMCLDMLLVRVGQRLQEELEIVRFCPAHEAVMEPLKTKAYQPLDTGENPKHSIRYSFKKMSM